MNFLRRHPAWLIGGLCLIFSLSEVIAQNPAVARPAPAWLSDGIFYEVFPRDFSAAGNLDGVTAQLDRLKDLGVTVIWTMPIHPIGEKFRKGDFGSPYSIKDFYAVDPHYGTVDDFKKLVSESHHRGIKVIMDVVACHTSWDSVMMAHPEFYKHDASGKMIPPVPEWTDVAALNYDNAALRQYMIAMLKYWVQTCDVDGFRCDSAVMVPTDFWEQSRAELEKIRPNILLLAEGSKPELMNNAFDIDYSWPLMGTLNDVIIHGKPASSLHRIWEDSRKQFPKDALHLEISDDHDEKRAVTRFGSKGAAAASVLMFTLDGAPLIYNGMEVGDPGESAGDALFEKVDISWSATNRPPFRNFYHDLIQLRHRYPALRNFKVDWLPNSNEDKLLTFKRSDDRDELLIVINLSKQPINGRVKMDHADGFTPMKIAGMSDVSGGSLPALKLNAFEWGIYHRDVK